MKKQPVLSSNTSISYVPTTSSRTTSGRTASSRTTSGRTVSSRTTSGPTTSRLAYSDSVYESSFASYTDTPVIDDIIIGSMDIYDDVIVQMRNNEGYMDDNLQLFIKYHHDITFSSFGLVIYNKH